VRVAIYARYPGDRKRPTSIADQIRICRTYAERQGWVVSEDHVYRDAGLSGELTAKRPGYQALLSAGANRAFGAILTEDQSRLWRYQEETHRAIRCLRFFRVKVFSVATGSDLTDRSGRVLATVMGLKDEAYIDDLREKTHRGLEVQVLRGYSGGGRAYDY
jgi:DNA invertase Pin-like site-specific DNA recombinase